MPYTVFFAGAHADDIELGAGALAARLAEKGHRLHAAIYTSETPEAIRETRQREALRALGLIGIPENHVFFCHFPDGAMPISSHAVKQMRHMLAQRHIEPDLVFTHTEADSHHDHRTAFQLTLGVFRKKVVLGFPVASSFIPSRFIPALAAPCGAYADIKQEALRCHRSQMEKGRIRSEAVHHFMRWPQRLGCETPAELFDLTVQYDAEISLAALRALVADDILCSVGQPVFEREDG